METSDMTTTFDAFLRDQLTERRHKLEHAARRADHTAHLQNLLAEVDSALARLEDGCYGICESCHESIECDRLMADPLVRFCLGHLNEKERSALERDLELAQRVQMGLLPKGNFRRDGWQICYHYEPAGLVSGDYCDVIDAGENGIYFMVGDVSGKGVAASMLMAHLHAMFRTLIPVGYSLACMLEHASRVFRESTLPNQYATLVGGRAWPDGQVEICNAGHPLPLLVRENGAVEAVATPDLPIGLFGGESFLVNTFQLGRGDGLVIYSDGVSEATDMAGAEYGVERLRALVGSGRERALDAAAMVALCRDDLAGFRRGAGKGDDVTVFVLGRG